MRVNTSPGLATPSADPEYPPGVDAVGEGALGDDSSRHWLIERRVRVYPRILLVMFGLTIPLYALTFEGGLDSRGRPMGTDFIAFWSAARVTVEGLTIDPWNLRELELFQLSQFPGLSGPTAFVSPPTTLAVVWPLGHLPFSAAFLTWSAFGLAAFLIALRPLLADRRHGWPLALAFPGLWIGLAHGQTQFVTAALTGAALILLKRHPYAAGVLIGLLAIKPHLAILFPIVLVAGRHWRTFASAAVTATAFMSLSALAFGLDSLRSWINGMGMVGSAIDAQALPVYKFVTPYTALRLVGLPEPVSLVLHGLIAIGAASVVWILWRRTDDIRVRGSSMVFGTFLVTPYAADYDLTVLAFPVAWLAMIGLERGWHRGDRDLLVATWMIPVITAPVAAVTHLCVVPLLMALVLHRLWSRTIWSADITRVQSDDHWT